MPPDAPTRSRGKVAAFPRVDVATGLAFELLAELGAFTSGSTRMALESGKGWVRGVRRRAGTQLLQAVERYDLGAYLQLAAVALRAAPPRGVDELLAALAAMDPTALQRCLVGAESVATRSMASPGAFDRAIAGDAAGRREIRALFRGDRRGRDSMDRVLSRPAPETQAELIGIVRGWSERVFPETSSVARAAIERDADAKRAMLAGGDPAAVIAAATNGIEFSPPSWTSEVVLVPAVALRPFVVSTESDATTIFIHPVDDEALDQEPGAPPRRLVKLAAALGDELRLRILRALGDEALSGAEIAERLNVDRTTIHHHLGILRAAGLLTLRDERERGWHYVRRPEGAAIAAELDAYIGSRRPGSGPDADRDELAGEEGFEPSIP